jgi:hypothetical protein
MVLPDRFVELMRGQNPCFITTLMPDGSPQTTQTWVDTDGARVIINTVQTHQKMRNIERDPRVSVAVCDAADVRLRVSASARGAASTRRSRPLGRMQLDSPVHHSVPRNSDPSTLELTE